MSQGAGAEVPIPLSALAAVQQALRTVHTAAGLQATLQAIADGVTTSTPYQEIAVTVAKEPNAAELHTITVVGTPEAQAALLNTTCQRAALEEHLAGGEQWGSLRLRRGPDTTEGITTYWPEFEPLDVPDAWLPDYELNAPLYAPDGELVGMLSMDQPRGGRIPAPWVNEILEVFAEQAVIAILNARRHEQALRAMETLEREKAELHAAFTEQCARETHLRSETRRDPLTGLANRVMLEERLAELLAAQTPVAVVFCDLDHFKQVNDTHGHAVGDEVLRVTGHRLARSLADAACVARIGGDEFVVVAADVQEPAASKLLQRIGEAFSAEPVEALGLRLRVTSSLGLVCEAAHEGPVSPARRVEELLDRADREMYAHKRSRAGVDHLLTLADRA
ncbi:GGDEF domain-containing protein [Actinospica sp.]|uniref:GGDEF domain-containing protein n=1 Tax=Actinospica sp. TaxID=1872142 RepID=UPI002C816FE6|nr:GGDEF domain-containing protein [Actinospica sp.]HWG27051.1 GGDEF domain-containing protein [Actinospica sp.]